MSNSPNASSRALTAESDPAFIKAGTSLSGATETLPRIRKRTRPAIVPPAAPEETSNRQLESLAIEYVAPESLVPYARKLRKHSQKHIAALMGSLRAFGFVAPMIVDDKNIVIDGEALLDAAIRVGIKTVPIVRLNSLSAKMVQACRVALNKLAEGVTWDAELIKFEMIEIEPTLIAHDIEFEAIGFSTTEFDLMVGSPPTASDDLNDELPLSETAVTEPGDLWQLGEHRLLCGNSLEEASFARLLDGEKATMAFCDPPFNGLPPEKWSSLKYGF